MRNPKKATGRGRSVVVALTAVVAILAAKRIRLRLKHRSESTRNELTDSTWPRNTNKSIRQYTQGGHQESDSADGRDSREGTIGAQTAVGITFIDLLFAAVLARVLELSNTSYLAGAPHLILAVTVIVTSWIGYRNSSNRAREGIKFFNIAFFQFVVEIFFLYIYWLLASTYEGRDSILSPVITSATPEAAIMVVFFALNCIWDQLALWRRKSKKYPAYNLGDDRPRRRWPTRILLVIYAAYFVFLGITDIGSWAGVAIVDLTLAVTVILHRFLQGIRWVAVTRREIEV